MSMNRTQVAKDETGGLIAADKVEGTEVYNRAGEHIGEIDNIMIDKLSGKVAYAVMSFGGFLGIGERYHPVPWSMLKYDTGQGGYVVDLDKKVLTDAPNYEPNRVPDYADRAWGKKLHDYYGVAPYWY